MANFDAEELFWKNISDSNDAKSKIIWNAQTEEEFNRHTLRDISFIKEKLNILPTETVLDYGAGIGRLCKGLANSCKYITGLDVSNSMITHSKAYLEGIKNASVQLCSTLGESYTLLMGYSYDKIFSFIAMQHVNKYKVFYILQNLKCYLAPGGKGLFQFPDLLKSQGSYKGYALSFVHNSDNTCSLHFWTKEEAKFIFELAGWKVTDIIDWDATGTDFWVVAE